MGRAEIALDCRNLHGEGVFWDDRDGRLWWTDIHGKKLWWFEPEESIRLARETAASEVARVLKGERPLNPVNNVISRQPAG